MKILLPRRSERGFASTLWVMVIAFLIFIIVIGSVVITLCRTIKRICPPPKPDENGYTPGIGDAYMGGVIDSYVPPPHFTPQYLQDAAPPGFTIHHVYIFAADSPRPPAWTNCIWNGALDSVTNAFGTNGLPMESWPAGQMPMQRYYNVVLSNSFGL